MLSHHLLHRLPVYVLLMFMFFTAGCDPSEPYYEGKTDEASEASRGEYTKTRVGMTYDEVTEIMGGGMLLSAERHKDYMRHCFTWHEPDGGTFVLYFSYDGILTDKDYWSS